MKIKLDDGGEYMREHCRDSGQKFVVKKSLVSSICSDDSSVGDLSNSTTDLIAKSGLNGRLAF